MGYIGNQTSNSYTSITKQDITGNGGTGYTLDHAVANAQEIEVFVNNVRQEPGVAYTVSGTTLTMTGNVAASDDFYVVFQGKALQTTVPPDDSVTTARINDDAVTTAKIADTAVTNAKVDTVAATKLTGTLAKARLPAGTLVKTTLFPIITPMTVANTSSYNNDRSRFRHFGSSYDQTVTLETDNPILLITGSVGVFSTGGSHTYFDFSYVYNSTTYWVSQQIAGSTTVDGLAAAYQTNLENLNPFPIHAAYETSYAAGTSLTFKPHGASWSATTLYINSYASANNRNQDMVTRFICQEIATQE